MDDPSAPELILWRRLSVFAGGFTLEAAEAVDAGGSSERGEVRHGLSQLVDSSRLMVEAEGEEIRYRIPEPLAREAYESLIASGEGDLVQEQLVAYCLSLAEEEQRAHYTPRRRYWLERLERERENLRVALRWLAQQGDSERGLQLVIAFYWLWAEGGHPEGSYLSEGREWFARFLASQPASARTPLRALALELAAGLALNQQVYATWRGHEPLPSGFTGEPTVDTALYATACSMAEESLAIKQELGDRPGVAQTLIHLAHIEGTWGNAAAARARYEEGLDIYRELRNKNRVLVSLSCLADLALNQGDAAAAAPLVQESLTQCQELGEHFRFPSLVEKAAGVAAGRGQPVLALRLAGAAAAYREAMGDPLHPMVQAEVDRWLEPARQALDEATQATASNQGRAMTPEQALTAAEAAIADICSR